MPNHYEGAIPFNEQSGETKASKIGEDDTLQASSDASDQLFTETYNADYHSKRNFNDNPNKSLSKAQLKNQRLAELRKFRSEVIKRDRHRCRNCERYVRGEDATLDHQNPEGPATLSNIHLLCRACNAAKGHRTWDEFQQSQAEVWVKRRQRNKTNMKEKKEDTSAVNVAPEDQEYSAVGGQMFPTDQEGRIIIKIPPSVYEGKSLTPSTLAHSGVLRPAYEQEFLSLTDPRLKGQLKSTADEYYNHIRNSKMFIDQYGRESYIDKLHQLKSDAYDQSAGPLLKPVDESIRTGGLSRYHIPGTEYDSESVPPALLINQPKVIHASSDISGFLDDSGTVVGEYGLYVSPHGRGTFLTSRDNMFFGSNIESKNPGFMIYTDEDTVSQVHNLKERDPTRYIGQGSAESEGILLPGTRLPPVHPITHIEGGYNPFDANKKIDVYASGNIELSEEELAAINRAGIINRARGNPASLRLIEHDAPETAIVSADDVDINDNTFELTTDTGETVQAIIQPLSQREIDAYDQLFTETYDTDYNLKRNFNHYDKQQVGQNIADYRTDNDVMMSKMARKRLSKRLKESDKYKQRNSAMHGSSVLKKRYNSIKNNLDTTQDRIYMPTKRQKNENNLLNNGVMAHARKTANYTKV